MRNRTVESETLSMAEAIVLKPSYFSLGEIQATIQELLDIIEEDRRHAEG